MGYEYIPSPNKSSRNGNQVGGIIAHFTAWGNINGTIRYMCNKIPAPYNVTKGVTTIDGQKYYDAKSSCHYITGRDGRTVMLVPENEAAWHAGSSTTKPTLNGKGSLNLWTIGHEICNWGALRKVGDTYFCWPDNWTYPYSGPEPVYMPKKCIPAIADNSYKLKNDEMVFKDGMIEYWEPYTDEQIKSTIVLWKDIIDRYQIPKEYIAGHDDIDPKRKIDVGPAFNWSDIFNELYPSKVISKPEPDLLSQPANEGITEVHIPTRQSPRNDQNSILTAICRALFS